MKNFGIFFNPNIENKEKIIDLLKQFHDKEGVKLYRFTEQDFYA